MEPCSSPFLPIWGTSLLGRCSIRAGVARWAQRGDGTILGRSGSSREGEDGGCCPSLLWPCWNLRIRFPCRHDTYLVSEACAALGRSSRLCVGSISSISLLDLICLTLLRSCLRVRACVDFVILDRLSVCDDYRRVALRRRHLSTWIPHIAAFAAFTKPDLARPLQLPRGDVTEVL